MAKFDIAEVINEIRTKLASGIGTISASDIKRITEPLPTPKKIPCIYLVPINSEKVRRSNEYFYHIHTIRIIPVIRLATTEEESLIDTTSGLVKICTDIEGVLENDMLNDGSDISQLNNCSIQIDEYAYAEGKVADGIYCRAGLLTYTAQTKVYQEVVS